MKDPEDDKNRDIKEILENKETIKRIINKSSNLKSSSKQSARRTVDLKYNELLELKKKLNKVFVGKKSHNNLQSFRKDKMIEGDSSSDQSRNNSKRKDKSIKKVMEAESEAEIEK